MCFSVEQFYRDSGKVSAIIRVHFSFQDYLDFYRKRNYVWMDNHFFCQKKTMNIYADFFTSRKEASEFYTGTLAA